MVAGLQQREDLTEKEKRILAYHEAGHALMSYLMGEIAPVQKVTIVSRGTRLGLRATTFPPRIATCTRRKSSST